MGEIVEYAESRLALPGKQRTQLWGDTLLGEIVDRGRALRRVQPACHHGTRHKELCWRRCIGRSGFFAAP